MDKSCDLVYTRMQFYRSGDIMRDIYGYIRKLALRKLIILTAVFIVLIIVILAAPFRAAVSPVSVSSAEEITEAYQNGNKYIQLENVDIFYAGYDHVSDDEAVASYYYVIVDDEYIFILIPLDETGEHASALTWSGRAKISTPTTYSDFIIAFAQAEEITDDEASAGLGGCVIDAYGFTVLPYLTALVVFTLAVIVLLIFIIMNAVVYINPRRSGTFSRLGKFESNPDGAKRAAKQLKSRSTKRFGNIFLTDDFFIGFTNRNVYVVPLDNIMRAVRPAGNKVYVIIDTEPKARYKIPLKSRKNADDVVEAIRSIF